MYLPAYTALKYDAIFLANKAEVSVFYYFSCLFNFTTARGAAEASPSAALGSRGTRRTGPGMPLDFRDKVKLWDKPCATAVN